MLIREANENDLPALVDLYQQLGDAGPGITLDRARQIFARIRKYPSYRIFLATDEGRICGTFALLIFDALGYRAAPVGVVEDVVVDEKYRGRGTGKAMMEFALERCREAGCYKMMLSSNVNREDAHRFYQSLGFEKHGYSFQVRAQNVAKMPVRKDWRPFQ